MPDGTLYDTGAPTIEVRVYHHDRLLVRELCESEDEVAAVVAQWSELEGLLVLVDNLSATHGPDDILAPEEPLPDDDEARDDLPLGLLPVPGIGTE